MPINIDQEIAKIDNEILALRGQIPALTTSYNDWLSQSRVACTQTLKSKRDECVADKNMKRNKASVIQTQISTINLDIDNKVKYRQSLLEQKSSENKQGELLASQGMSQGALLVKAQAEADAIKTVADEQAKAVTIDAESSNQRKNIIFISVIVVVLVVGILVYKKFKNKK
jgi:hypothetical protein